MLDHRPYRFNTAVARVRSGGLTKSDYLLSSVLYRRSIHLVPAWKPQIWTESHSELRGVAAREKVPYPPLQALVEATPSFGTGTLPRSPGAPLLKLVVW